MIHKSIESQENTVGHLNPELYDRGFTVLGPTTITTLIIRQEEETGTQRTEDDRSYFDIVRLNNRTLIPF